MEINLFHQCETWGRMSLSASNKLRSPFLATHPRPTAVSTVMVLANATARQIGISLYPQISQSKPVASACLSFKKVSNPFKMQE